MKIIFIGLTMLVSVSTFASELCGQNWKSNGHYYADSIDGMSDIEVLIPAHATPKVRKHFKESGSAACLKGVIVKAGQKEVFIAVDINH